MSKTLKLLSFHGQGSKFDVNKVLFKSITVEQLYKNRFQDYCINSSCYQPDVISLLNNLSFQDYMAEKNELIEKKEDSLILGHSLGELQFLSCNKLISTEDLMQIATKRDELMKYEMRLWKERNFKGLTASNNSDDLISTYSLLISPKLLKQNPGFVKETLLPMMNNEIGHKTLTVSLYNTATSIVSTGLTNDFNQLFEIDSRIQKALIKKIKLPNVSQIAFHNKKFLSNIEEPLNDFIFKTLVKNKHSHIETLDIPVFSSYSNKINKNVLSAMEDFTKSSFSTIPFYDNCLSIKRYIKDRNLAVERIDLGPSDVLSGILNKNGLK
ncbi:hypothetical protein QEN19_001467 [Hanseniaspora menglaensis]